ncbi:MAG TPA: NAD-dependent DNA ligase LigA, partial [Rariglobus sp.]
MNVEKLCTPFHRRMVGAMIALMGGVALVPASAYAGDEPSITAITNPEEPGPAQARIRWLRAEIARHNDLYFKKAAPEVTDAEYDRLKRELVTLEKTSSQARVAPSKKAGTTMGDDRSGAFPTCRHREPMLSLDKAYTEAELRMFLITVERTLRRDDLHFIVEPKFDGLAISVTYEQGRLVRAVTRGDGLEGDDVTANVLTIAGLPRMLNVASSESPANPVPEVVELRGEVYLDFAEFARINMERTEAGEEPYAHPRNLAAGTLKQRDPAEVAKRRLSVVFYGLGAWEGPVPRPASQQALHALVRAWGLPAVETWKAAGSPDEAWAAVEFFGRGRSAFAFPTDGVVVKIDSLADQRELGVGEEAPRWAVA